MINSIYLLCFKMFFVIHKLHVIIDMQNTTPTNPHITRIEQAIHPLLNRQIHNYNFIHVNKFCSHTSQVALYKSYTITEDTG